MRKKIAIILTLLVIAVGSLFIFFKKDAGAPASSSKPPANNSQAVESPAPQPANDETNKYTIDNQNSIYFIVNKQRALPSTFVPQNLVTVGGEQMRSDTATALNNLFSAAKKDGISMKALSGYRSYSYQQRVYQGYVNKDGQAKADTYSARPGHSEHQTGLAVDVGNGQCDLQQCFGQTQAGKWLAANAGKYGFIIRYQQGKESLTGYQYEPWHLRYVGIELAGKLQASGQTIEQYFNLPAATSY